MNRRRFLVSLMILGGGAVATYYGGKFVESHGAPDLDYLDQNQDLIADLAEVIIPKTSTPGAKDAEVEKYITHIIKKTSDVTTQNNFINGLKNVKEYAESEYGFAFNRLTKEQRIEVIEYFRQDGKNYSGKLGKIKDKVLGKSFFSILKEYTCIAYCSSMQGATRGLAYEAIPSRYLAVTPYTKGQKSWATK